MAQMPIDLHPTPKVDRFCPRMLRCDIYVCDARSHVSPEDQMGCETSVSGLEGVYTAKNYLVRRLS
jgi:hypothetical protein